MSKILTSKQIEDVIDEAVAWFVSNNSPAKEVDFDYTKSYYWGLEDEEKEAISFYLFHFAVKMRVVRIFKCVENSERNYG